MNTIHEIDEIAKKAYQELKSHWDHTGEREIPDYSIAPIELIEMPTQSFLRYLRIAPTEILPETAHSLWMAEFLLRGWKYGREFSLTHRTDPRLRPFIQLSDNEKEVADIMISTFRFALPKTLFLKNFYVDVNT